MPEKPESEVDADMFLVEPISAQAIRSISEKHTLDSQPLKMGLSVSLLMVLWLRHEQFVDHHILAKLSPYEKIAEMVLLNVVQEK